MSEPQQVRGEAFYTGMELGEVVFGPLTRDDIVRYAHASGDFNPIHRDEEYARAQGAPTVFAMGMLPAAYLGHAVADWIGGPQHLRRFKVRFKTRVWPGDELACRGLVTAAEGGSIMLTVEALRRGPGPADLEVPEEETAIIGEADAELVL